MKHIIKRFLVIAISLSLVIPTMNQISSYASVVEGEDVIPADGHWTSFSVRDDLNYDPPGEKTDWEKAIEEAMQRATAQAEADYRAGRISEEEYNQKLEEIESWPSSTQGRVYTPNMGSDVTLLAFNTGRDGEYIHTQSGESVLVADNPWGLTLSLDKIPVEFGRSYTMEFDIDTTLQGVDPDTHQKKRADKYCLVKGYDYQSQGEPAAEFETFIVNGEEGTKDGKFKIANTPKDSSEPVKTHIEATFRIPDNNADWSAGHDKGSTTSMGIKFAFGAFLKTYQDEMKTGDVNAWDEISLNGFINVTNMKVIAGPELPTTTGAETESQTQTPTQAPTQAPTVKPTKKDNSALINQIKVSKPVVKKTIKKKTAKKISVKLKKAVAIADGYNVNVYKKKKAKKAIVKKTVKNKKSFKISSKKLKKLKKAYIKVRAFKIIDNVKYYGKWSKPKKVIIKQ